jgi:hypothetical protein
VLARRCIARLLARRTQDEATSSGAVAEQDGMAPGRLGRVVSRIRWLSLVTLWRNPLVGAGPARCGWRGGLAGGESTWGRNGSDIAVGIVVGAPGGVGALPYDDDADVGGDALLLLTGVAA